MATRSKLDWLCRASTSVVFIALSAIGQCVAQNPVDASSYIRFEALKRPEIPEGLNQRPDTNAPVSAPAQAKKASSMRDRVKERGRKFPARDHWTAIGIVKHVNGIFGGLE